MNEQTIKRINEKSESHCLLYGSLVCLIVLCVYVWEVYVFFRYGSKSDWFFNTDVYSLSRTEDL
jgi:hypothetical protein